MSVILYVLENGHRRDILRIGERRKDWFHGLAEVAASLTDIPTGLHLDGSPNWLVEPKEFCALVESVFERPSGLNYAWAAHAAYPVEVIKGEYIAWDWPPGHLPFEVFRPTEHERPYPPISIHCTDKNGRRTELERMTENDAYWFTGTAGVAAKIFGISSGIDHGHSSLELKEDEFCELVQAVFSSPSEITFAWARKAARFHDLMKRQPHDWRWPTGFLAFDLFSPHRFETEGLEWKGNRIGTREDFALFK